MKDRGRGFPFSGVPPTAPVIRGPGKRGHEKPEMPSPVFLQAGTSVQGVSGSPEFTPVFFHLMHIDQSF